MLRPAMTLLALSLAACGQAGDENGADMLSPVVNETRPAPANASAPEPADQALLGYRGKYPSEKIEGVAFFDQKLVRDAVVRAVGSAPGVTADQLLGMEGPETPIAYADGMLTAWRCEAHNCGPHNWSLTIAPDGGKPRVCYHDDDASPQTLWFEDGKRTGNDDDCATGSNPG